MKIDTIKIANDIYVRETRRYQNVRKRDYYPVEYHLLCLIINPEHMKEYKNPVYAAIVAALTTIYVLRLLSLPSLYYKEDYQNPLDLKVLSGKSQHTHNMRS